MIMVGNCPQALALVADHASCLSLLVGSQSRLRTKSHTALFGGRSAAKFIGIASRIVRSCSAVPGPDARERFHDMRLALPADCDAYLRRKEDAIITALGELAPLWGRS